MRKVCIAAALIAGTWGLNVAYRSRELAWVHPAESGGGHARILRFYASTGAVTPGQRVRVCYAVENARRVRISPLVAGVYPARDYCLEVAPEHTMHFTLWAEGFDGSVAARSFTLPVQAVPAAAPVPAVAIAGM